MSPRAPEDLTYASRLRTRNATGASRSRLRAAARLRTPSRVGYAAVRGLSHGRLVASAAWRHRCVSRPSPDRRLGPQDCVCHFRAGPRGSGQDDQSTAILRILRSNHSSRGLRGKLSHRVQVQFHGAAALVALAASSRDGAHLHLGNKASPCCTTGVSPSRQGRAILGLASLGFAV